MIPVPELILGTAQLVQPYGITAKRTQKQSFETAAAFVRTAAQLGFRTVDTAPVYGEAEKIVGTSGIDFTIHTKIKPGVDPSESMRGSLQQLGLKTVDVLYVHDCSALHRPDRLLIDGLEAARNTGADAIGVSIYEVSDLAFIPDELQLDVVQVPMNVLDRRFDKVFIDEQLGLNRRIVARSAFLQGVLLADPAQTKLKALGLDGFVTEFQHVCAEIGVTALAGCLGWIRSIEGIDGVIVGAQDIAELEQIVDGWNQATSLPADSFKHLSRPDSELVDPRKWPS